MTSPKSCVGLLATFAALVSLFQFHAQAGLVDGGGDLLNDLNNAIRFDPSTPTPAIVAFKDANLPLDRYIQVGFRTTNSSAFNITGIAWSKDNVTYTDFAPNNFVNNVNSPSDYVYSSIIDLGTPIGGTSNSLFFVRYTIPSGIDAGKLVQSKFNGNSDGFATSGVLDNGVTNNFVSITRLHTAVPEPASLLLALSATSLFGWKWRRIQLTRR
ncbi:MAG: PEP-CTERM sorting domain-containing protein [Planctomycetota bacterium]|jgi:hypothetical protein